MFHRNIWLVENKNPILLSIGTFGAVEHAQNCFFRDLDFMGKLKLLRVAAGVVRPQT
jgi:hypothetical protein